MSVSYKMGRIRVLLSRKGNGIGILQYRANSWSNIYDDKQERKVPKRKLGIKKPSHLVYSPSVKTSDLRGKLNTKILTLTKSPQQHPPLPQQTSSSLRLSYLSNASD